jgi:hypothetical protein
LLFNDPLPDPWRSVDGSPERLPCLIYNLAILQYYLAESTFCRVVKFNGNATKNLIFCTKTVA